MNGMEYQELLGKYSEREIAFMQSTKTARPLREISTDAIDGLISAGKSMDSDYHYFPPVEELSEHIENVMRSINGNAE